MSIIGIQLDRTNPTFTINDFTFWMPQYKKLMQTEDGLFYFNKLYSVVNNKIYKSIYGSDWEYAMSLAIAHYLTLIAENDQVPSGNTLAEIAGGGATKGVVTSASVGGFSKSFDIDKTMSKKEEALFWNQTSFGAQLMALLETKAQPSLFVVTTHPVVP